MKIEQLFAIALASASLAIASCGKEDHTSEQAPESGAQQQTPGTGAATAPTEQPPPAPAGEATGGAGAPQPTQGGEQAGAPAAQPATEAQQKVVGELQDLQTKVNVLEQKALGATEQQKASLVDQLNALKKQRQRLEEKAKQTAASGVKAVNDLLSKVNDSLDVLTRSVEPEETSSGAGAPAEGPK